MPHFALDSRSGVQARCHGSKIEGLLAKREVVQARYDAGAKPDFLPETRHVREGDWQVRIWLHTVNHTDPACDALHAELIFFPTVSDVHEGYQPVRFSRMSAHNGLHARPCTPSQYRASSSNV